MAFSPLDSPLLGGLFTTDAMRAIFTDRALVASMLRVEAALARAQTQVGIAPAALADAISSIDPDSLDIAALGRETALSGVPTIPFVKAVQKRLPRELEAAFHRGATTQDILDSAVVLQMRDGFALLRDDLRGVVAGLVALARRHRDTPCAGRTYGQHAAPITFGFKVAGWLTEIAGIAGRLDDLQSRTLMLSLAGPVGTLTALGDKAEAVLTAMAAELGLAVPPLAWHTRRAVTAEIGHWLASLMGALGKMATDIAHLATTEVGEVAEPYIPGRGGSSAMPHKRNPVSCTVIIAAAEAARGPAGTLLASMLAAHERPAGAWHAEWHALPQLFGLAAGAVAEARRLAEGLEIDPARMAANLDITRGLLFADAAAGVLTAAMSRADAHHAVEQAANAVRQGEGSLFEVLDRLVDSSVDRQKLRAAFDISPPVAAAGRFVDRAISALPPV